jgi:hypothetical protein
MPKRIPTVLSSLLALSISTCLFASPTPPDPTEENSTSVQARIKTMGAFIPVTPQSPTPASKVKRNFSLSLKGSSSSVTKDSDTSSSSSSPRYTSPMKPEDAPLSSSSSFRGFSYTAGNNGSSRSPSSSTSKIDIPPLPTSPKEERTSSSGKSSPETSEKDSPSRTRSKSNSSSKKALVLSAPVAQTAFITIKDPEAELEELLKSALTLCGSALAPLAKTEKDSNERIDLVVKPMLEDLKSSIKNITAKKEQISSILDSKQRAQALGDPVSFFRMTINRAMTQIPFAVKWALEQPLENTDLEKYFATMLMDAKKSQEIIIIEHTQTKVTLMTLTRELYFGLLKKISPQSVLERRRVVDAYLIEYTTYMNGMDDQLKEAIGKPISFNSLNRDFNTTIGIMRKNLQAAIEWAAEREEGIDPELKYQLLNKQNELETPPSSSEKFN